MDIIEKAINFAAVAHIGQTRKGTDIPYITHPFAVGMLLSKVDCSEEVIAAGILHDTIEDTDVTYEELIEEFGVNVANLVLSASEQDKSLSWLERKQHTIEMIKKASLEEIQVITADKLHNLRSIKADLETFGDAVWERFKKGKNNQHWYYASIVQALASNKEQFILVQEIEREVVEVFGGMDYLEIIL